MKKFENVLLNDNTKDFSYLLEDLKTINVFCGKNNSGKTTLLKTLKDKKKRQIGIKLTLNFIESINSENDILYDENGFFDPIDHFIYEVSKDHVINYFHDEYKGEIVYKETLTNEIINYLHRKGIFTINYDEDGDYWEFIDEDDPFKYNPNRVRDFINKLFEFEGILRFIDAKRTAISSVEYESSAKRKKGEIASLITYLFETKNAVEGNQDKNWYEYIKKVYKKISGGYDFDVVLMEGKINLYFSNKKSNWYHAENVGLGFRDLLYILASATLPGTDIILIEEPENHLHPELQRELLRFLYEETDKQYFISTHSSVFLDNNYVDKIFFLKYSDKISVTEVTEKSLLLKELGYSTTENLQADILIIVEGKTDIPIVEEFLRKLEFIPNYEIKILGLGHINSVADADYKSLSKNFNQIIILVDGDQNKPSKDARKNLLTNIKDLGNVHLVCLKGYGIENYLSLNAIQNFYQINNYTLDKIFYDCIDTKSSKLLLDREIKGFRKDARNYREIAILMSEEDIKNTGDLYDNFIKLIKRLCVNMPKTLSSFQSAIQQHKKV